MIEVRKARLSESDIIVELQMRMAQETEQLQLDRDVVSEGVRGVFQEPARGTYWVAGQDGQIVAVLLAVPEWSDWRNGTVLWMHSLYVIPKARQQGVFRKLYQHLKRQVELSDDLVGLRLYVDKRNEAAQEVYDRLGMTKEHYDLFEWLK